MCLLIIACAILTTEEESGSEIDIVDNVYNASTVNDYCDNRSQLRPWVANHLCTAVTESMGLTQRSTKAQAHHNYCLIMRWGVQTTTSQTP